MFNTYCEKKNKILLSEKTLLCLCDNIPNTVLKNIEKFETLKLSVLCNEYIINMMTPTINNNIDLFNYLFGYAWLRFYFEETINRYKVKTTDMYIFDINTASKLPAFYFNHNNPHNNRSCS